MTKNERTYLAYVFRTAKEFLWDGNDQLMRLPDSDNCGLLGANHRARYICHCIDNAIATNRVDWYTGRKAIRIVNKRLGKNCTLESWLNERRVDIYIQGGTYHHTKLQATRLAWLNSLIEEFSK